MKRKRNGSTDSLHLHNLPNPDNRKDQKKENNDQKVQDIKPKLDSFPQDQYHATLNSVDLVFRLEEVKGDGSCMFLSNGITRKYWVDFLQRCYDYLSDHDIERFNFFRSIIHDDIFTMFENDFALCDSDEKAIANKKALYNGLYERQFGNNCLSPYPALVDAFLAGKRTGNWLFFNEKCNKYEIPLNHLELYRCESFEKLKLWPSIKLMTAFASLRHQYKDASGTMSYHVIWQQNQEGNRQLSLLYPTVEIFLSWLKSNQQMHHAVFHIARVHFNKLILINKSPEIKILVNDQNEEDDEAGMLGHAIYMSLNISNAQDSKEESKKNQPMDYSQDKPFPELMNKNPEEDEEDDEDGMLGHAIYLSLKTDAQDEKEESKKNQPIEDSQNKQYEDDLNLATALSLSDQNLKAGFNPPSATRTSIFLKTMDYGVLARLSFF